MPSRPPARLLLTALLALCAGLTPTAPSAAEETSGRWLTTRKACKFAVWNEFPDQEESVIWNGPCQNNEAHGIGTLQWYRGERPSQRDTGQAVHGKFHGKVVTVASSQARFEGEYVHGRATGLVRHIYNKTLVAQRQDQSPYREWFADGYWDGDDLVVPMLYSRFKESRPCPRSEQQRDLCVFQLHALLNEEKAQLATLHHMGRCLNIAEGLAEVHDELLPDRRLVQYYLNAYGKIQDLAHRRGLADHLEDAQDDTRTDLFDDLLGPAQARLETARAQLDDKALDKRVGQLSVEALAPYFRKNCTALLK